MSDARKNTRNVFPATGTKLTAKSWLTEAPMRMLMNNLDPDVAERPRGPTPRLRVKLFAQHVHHHLQRAITALDP